MSEIEALDLPALEQMLLHSPQQAAEQIRRHASAGSTEARFLLAQMLMEGRILDQDVESAFHWYSVAANSGHAMSMNMLGRCHELGQGTEIRPELAAVWYRKAADNGLGWGMYNYANLLATGRGIPTDRPASFRHYLAAAKLGHAKSMNLVGRYYEQGWEITADIAAAHEWYRRSAEAGDFRGQASYAAVLADRGQVDAAVHWARLASAGGHETFRKHLKSELGSSTHESLRRVASEI